MADGAAICTQLLTSHNARSGLAPLRSLGPITLSFLLVSRDRQFWALQTELTRYSNVNIHLSLFLMLYVSQIPNSPAVNNLIRCPFSARCMDMAACGTLPIALSGKP
jgi:hypothetical protein